MIFTDTICPSVDGKGPDPYYYFQMIFFFLYIGIYVAYKVGLTDNLTWPSQSIVRIYIINM